MRVLVTRPRADAEAFAVTLRAHGHTTFIEPLIDIAFDDGPLLDLKQVAALAFTSANGARAAARRTANRTIPILAVGPATAAEARAQGFSDISESIGEGVEGLTRHILAARKPTDGTILHVTGSVTAGDLKGALAAHGFTARTEQLYEARAAQTLTGTLAAELRAGLIDAATFFSPRTAALFAALIEAENLGPTCRGMIALTLSQPVANALHPLSFRDIRIATRPTAEALLALLAP